MPAKKHPYTVDRINYESETAAAKALEIGLMVLRSRLRSFHFPEYVSKYHKKEKLRRIPSISCTIEGVEYSSISSAAKNLEMSANTISSRLKSSDYPDYVCADIPKEPPKPIEYNYTVNGKKYRTLQEIGDMEGLTRERIRQKMNSPRHTAYQKL